MKRSAPQTVRFALEDEEEILSTCCSTASTDAGAPSRFQTQCDSLFKAGVDLYGHLRDRMAIFVAQLDGGVFAACKQGVEAPDNCCNSLGEEMTTPSSSRRRRRRRTHQPSPQSRIPEMMKQIQEDIVPMDDDDTSSSAYSNGQPPPSQLFYEAYLRRKAQEQQAVTPT